MYYRNEYYSKKVRLFYRLRLIGNWSNFYVFHWQKGLVPDDKDKHGQEDEVKTAEAVLE